MNSKQPSFSDRHRGTNWTGSARLTCKTVPPTIVGGPKWSSLEADGTDSFDLAITEFTCTIMIGFNDDKKITRSYNCSTKA